MLGVNKDDQVLIVEDDKNDAYFLELAFKQVGIVRKPFIAENGRIAIAYLDRQGEFKDRTRFPYPRWILTDLKMPIVDGFEVLTWLKAHPDLQIIPTVVFSSSNDREDVKRAYCLGANAFFCKPQDPAKFRNMVTAILDFWTQCERCTIEENLPACEELRGRV